MNKALSLLFLVLSFSAFSQSQETNILNSQLQRDKMAENSILKNYPARNIGPTHRSGRIVDIEVNLADTKEYYVGFGSGGIFRTNNNGVTFDPVFDNQGAMGIGDFALSQSDPNLLYVGTGEKNSSRSTYAGTGMYKTTDKGKTWTHLGLAGTQHISRVLIHPANNNTVWVASMGALYSNNTDRGVYKSADGGKTWKNTLYINDSTGISDLVINPQNPNQLWAASWERTRKAWNFKGNGMGSSVYRSEDGGETWTKSVQGFPQGEFVGRIGLDICWSKPNVLYAIVDNQEEVAGEKREEVASDKLKPADFGTMTKENFLKLDDKKLNDFLRDNRFPRKYDAKKVKKEVTENKYVPKALYDYLGSDANAELFSKKIKGAEVYRSDDGGKSWKKTHDYTIDGVYFTYGYYFAEMRVSPDRDNLIYIYGVPMLKSSDAGKTWAETDTVGRVHSDHHTLWINPKDSKHLLLGNDGGLYETYDEGKYWRHINNMPVGQFYTVNVDMETPYNVYGGLQDNGVQKGSSTSVPNRTKDWEDLFGGDGMFVAPDPRNSKLVYTGFQFGNYWRLELDKNKFTRITPQHDLGEDPLRWNWRTPVILSKHNPDIVYMAAQRLYRSMDKAENWEAISPDLSKNKPQGNVPFSTIASIDESPLQFGLLYAGTDDGNLWVSKNAGGSWDAINAGLPANKWVSSVSPSPHDKGTVFVSLNGYRDDDFRTYLFASTDFGKTWKSVKGNLPESVANVIIQDPVNADLLYCGLDNGTYASMDRGSTWVLLNNMLNVSSYDMMVHPRENELVVATHGRSVFVSDVKPLQQIAGRNANKGILVFAPESIRYSERWGNKTYEWSKAVEPKVHLMYYVGKAAPSILIEIYDEKNNLVRSATSAGTAGINAYSWDVKITEPTPPQKGKSKTPAVEPKTKYAPKGKYKIKMINGADSSEVNWEVK